MQISAAELKVRLISFAREIGFDSCRISACKAPPHAMEFAGGGGGTPAGKKNSHAAGGRKRWRPGEGSGGRNVVCVFRSNFFAGKGGGPRLPAEGCWARAPCPARRYRANRPLCVG